MQRAAAQDKLAPDAVPFPLREPVGRITQRPGRGFQRIGEIEGVRPRQVRLGVVGVNQPVIRHRVRRPASHQAVRKLCLVDPGRPGQGAGHQLLADTHAEAAGDELVEEEPLVLRQASPGVADSRAPFAGGPSGEGADAVDPVRKASVAGVRGFGQDQRDGLGQIADDRIAFLEQPERQACLRGGPFAQFRRRDAPPRPAPRKQRDGPEPVRFRRGAEILGQRGDLGVGRGGAVQRGEKAGEALHSASSPASSPWNSVSTILAS